MYLILLKIHFYGALSLLYPTYLKNLFDRITSLVLQKGFKLRSNRDGYLLFSLDVRREQADQILIDTAGIIEENLLNGDEWLNGYTILLDQIDRDFHEEVFYRLRDSSYTVMQDNKVWVGESLRAKKAVEWNLISQKGLSLLDKLLISGGDEKTHPSPYREHPVRALLEENLLRKKKVRGPTLLIDKELRALRLHVLDLLKDQEFVFYLPRPEDYEEPYAHFVGELAAFLQRIPVLDDRFSGDNWFEDVRNILSSQLDQIVNSSVVYLIFDRFSEWGDEFHRFWENIFRGIARHARPVFLEQVFPQVKGMGQPIDLQPYRLESIWEPGGLQKQLAAIDPLQKKLIYLCSRCRQPVEVRLLREFVVQSGEDGGIVDDKINLAVKNCLLTRIGDCVMAVELEREIWPTLLFEDPDKLAKSWLDFLLNHQSNLSLTRTIGYLIGSGSFSQLLTALRRYFRKLIDRKSSLFQRIVDLKRFPDLMSSTASLHHAWQVLHASAKLRHWLDATDHGGDLPHEIKEIENEVDPEIRQSDSDWQCQTARLEHLLGNLDHAYSRIRVSYSLSQKYPDAEIEILSALEIGQILMKRKKADEAAEYFGIAWREAEKSGLAKLEVHAALWAGVARFLIGNLKHSENAWKSAKELSTRYHFHRWSGLSSFLLGRLEFELGQYSKAIKHFENSAAIFGATARLWVARSLCYSGQSDLAIKHLQKEATTRESEFFLVESLYFSNRIQEAINIAQNWETLEYRPVLWQGFNWDMQTGFSCLEDRCLESDNDQTVLERQSLAFQDYLLLLHTESDHQTSIQRFEKICSDKQLSTQDPYTHQYFLWYSLVLGKGQVEKNARWSTLMGRGLKELQTRGSKIDDRDDRVLFLNTPWWNALLLNEARKNKLL